MIEYTICELVGRDRGRKRLCEFGFTSEPQAGDTVEIDRAVYAIRGRHWFNNGDLVLIVRKMGVVLR